MLKVLKKWNDEKVIVLKPYSELFVENIIYLNGTEGFENIRWHFSNDWGVSIVAKSQNTEKVATRYGIPNELDDYTELSKKMWFKDTNEDITTSKTRIELFVLDFRKSETMPRNSLGERPSYKILENIDEPILNPSLTDAILFLSRIAGLPQNLKI